MKKTSILSLEGTEEGKPGRLIRKIPWPFFAVSILLGTLSSLDSGLPSIVVLLLSILIFMTLIFKSAHNPIYAMMALIVYIPYSKSVAGNLGGLIPGLNYTTALMLIIIWGVVSNNKQSTYETPLPLEASFRRLVLFFCLIGAFSVIHSDITNAAMSIGDALTDYKRWIDPFLVFFLFSVLVKDEEDGKVLVYLMAFSMVIVGIGSIWIKHNLEDRVHLVRLSGIAGQPNTMGAFYANYVFMIIGFLVMKWRGLIRKSIFLVGIGGCLIGLFATESRGDALGFLMGMFAFLFLRNKILFFSFLGAIVFLALNLQFLPDGLRQRVEKTVSHQNGYGMSSSVQLDASARTRLAVWTGGLRMIETHPLVGVGYKMFQEYIFQYVDHTEETAHLSLRKRDGHNAYIMMAAEMGLPALFVFLIILLFMFRTAIQSYKKSHNPFWKTVSASTIASIVSLVVTNMFGSRFISLVLAGYLWGLMAILLKVPRWAEEHPIDIETEKALLSARPD